MVESSTQLLVGRVPFLVCCPYFYNSLTANLPYLSFTDTVPYQLNKLLAKNQIDCAPTSSIEYAQNYQKYMLLPKLCIGNSLKHSKVQSVLFFSNISWENLQNQPILLSKSSLTSNILFRILCLEKYKVKPNILDPHASFQNLNQNILGKICIGDRALEEDPNNWIFSYDLAQEWYQWQNLPFVFGLWIIHQNTYTYKKTLLLKFYENILTSLKKFKDNPQKALNQWQNKFPSSFKFSEREPFLSSLEYQLTLKHIQSLELFYKKAYANKFISSLPTLKFIPESFF